MPFMDPPDSQPPRKRAACDRCRMQKLRCLRVADHPADACMRCVRSQMPCVSSSCKRPGRPRNSTDPSRQHRATAPAPVVHGDANPALPTAEISQLADVDDWFNLGSLETDYEMSWDSVPSGFPLDGTHARSPVSGATAASTSALLDSLTTDAALHDPFPALPSDRGELTGMMPLYGDSPTTPPPTLDPGLHLSVLQRELSKQLFTLKSGPWDMARNMRITCSHEPGANGGTAAPLPSPSSGACNPSQADPRLNSLAKISTTCSEFTKLLGVVQSTLPGDGAPPTKDPSRVSSIHPRLSIADLLTILSCHMLILSIYDTIFSHFTDQALHNPGAVNMVMQAAPKLCLGGIAVPPRLDLLSHLLSCLMGGYLRPIERFLGLPDEFCVSWRRKPGCKDWPAGLFSGRSGQLLFSTLVKVETERAGQGQGGLGAIESLKDHMRRAQAFEE